MADFLACAWAWATSLPKEVWAAVIQAVPVLLAVVVAHRGLRTWRQDAIGRRRIALAEQIMDAALRLGDEIVAIRFTMWTDGPEKWLSGRNWTDVVYPGLKESCANAQAEFSRLRALCDAIEHFGGNSFIKDLFDVKYILDYRHLHVRELNMNSLADQLLERDAAQEEMGAKALADVFGWPNKTAQEERNKLVWKSLNHIRNEVRPILRK